jgi:hypothetical protein
MIEGALIALAGVLVGRFLPGRRRKTAEIKAICGCKHARSFHENGGKCKHLTAFDQNRCPCQHYDGPLPVEQFFATPMLPPSD